MSDTILDLNDVTVSFMARRGGTKTPVHAADHVSLDVRRGEIGRASCREKVCSTV